MLFRLLIKGIPFILICCLFISTPLHAQDVLDPVVQESGVPLFQRSDSLGLGNVDNNLYPVERSWAILDSVLIVYADTLTVSPLFMPVVFDGKLLPDEYELAKPYQPYLKPAYIPEQKVAAPFQDKFVQKELNRKAYLYLYQHAPTAIRYAEDLLPKDIPVASEIKVNPFKQIFQVERDVDFSSSDKPEMHLPDRRYWIANFETSIQFSQNHISENWHKGGNSNFNLLTINKFKHEYEKDRVKVSTSVEYKLSIYTAPNDTLRSYRVGDDAFTVVSSYGYKAFSNWFYSLSLDAKTQFLNNFYENKMTKSSAFLAPLTVNLGLGMEYKLNKKFGRYRSLDVSTNISPGSYNMKYINDEDVDHKRHGLDPDQKFLKNLGSKSNTTIQFNFDRNISLLTKLYYFTNYEKVEAEFENTINLAFSRFFSTRIYVNVRFDDSVKKKEETDSYFQFYEILSFGFNYKF